MKKKFFVFGALSLALLAFAAPLAPVSAASSFSWTGEGFVAHWNIHGVSIAVVITTFNAGNWPPLWMYVSAVHPGSVGNTWVKQDFSGYMKDTLPGFLYVRTTASFAYDTGKAAMHTIDITFTPTTSIQASTQPAFVNVAGAEYIATSGSAQWVFGIANLVIDNEAGPHPTSYPSDGAIAFISNYDTTINVP